jgi:gliding motility-associated-like protein
MKFSLGKFVLKICFLLHFLAAQNLFATHIVGGNIHYEYLGNSLYEVTLKVYRDCASSMTDFDDPVAIGVFDSNGNLVATVTIPLAEAIVSDVPVVTGNICLNAPEGICVKEAIFSATVNLPPSAGGYTLAYQRCCRNTTLLNTESNDDLGMTVYAQIPGPEIVEVNSNPEFSLYPPVIICWNEPFTFDHSATDTDGDQLVYEFCNPLLTNVPGFYINPPGAPDYPDLIFNPGFSASYPITSNPAFNIDPVSGLLTGTPTQLGQFVVGICVKEYRNGVLISTTNRDFQFNVATCDVQVVAAIPEQTDFCDGLTVDFLNNSINASNYFWDFGVEGTNDDTSTEENPSYTFPEQGSYTITLIANPGLSCADTATTVYQTFPVDIPQPAAPEFVCENGVGLWNFSVETNDLSGFSWDFGPDAIPAFSAFQNPQGVIFNSAEESINVQLTVSQGECIHEFELNVPNPPEPVAAIGVQDLFCSGLSYTFDNQSSNSDSYFWDFGYADDITDQSNSFEPEVLFPDSGTYLITLTVESAYTCPSTTSVTFSIYGDLSPYFAEPEPQCLSINEFDFVGTGATSDEAVYEWIINGPADITQSDSYLVENVHFTESGYFNVTLTITENQCTESITQTVWVVEEPVLELSLEGAEGCAPLSVSFINGSSSETAIAFEWDFGNGSSSTETSPQHVYLSPGYYTVTLTGTTSNGCVAQLTETVENAVYVYPSPVAFFDVSPVTVDITEAEVNITDLSEGSIDCWYAMSDGGSSDECDTTYTFTEGGYQQVVQYVMNEFGCVDSIAHLVVVEGFLFYAPNAFTSNNDGLNDFWKPVLGAVISYQLQIFNRWGEKIFETDNPDEPWLGNVNGGDYYVQDGIYVYRCQLEDRLSRPHIFTGHIVKLR